VTFLWTLSSWALKVWVISFNFCSRAASVRGVSAVSEISWSPVVDMVKSKSTIGKSGEG